MTNVPSTSKTYYPQSEIERYIAAAKAAGVPQDQLANFIRGGYVAQPHQLVWHAVARHADKPTGPRLIGIGGRRGPGKSHAVFAQMALDDCQRVPGLKLLFLRKALKAGRESFDDLRRKVLYCTEHSYKVQSGIIEFANASQIYLGHYRNESDIDNYLGIEYDGAGIEESTQLSGSKHEMLQGSVRSTKAGWRPRVYETTNPGGVGHMRFKTVFIEPYRKGVETTTRFLPASADQNIYLDDGYRDWLQGLTGTLGRMWRDGDFDVYAGQYFSTFRRDIHVIPAMREIPRGWRAWGSLDYGFAHYNTFHLFTENDGNTYIVDEYGARERQPKTHIEAMCELLARYNLTPRSLDVVAAGSDIMRRESNGMAVADQYQAAGFNVQPANDDRIDGALNFQGGFGDVDRGVKPWLYISERCTHLIDTIPVLEHDDHDALKVKKWDTDDKGEGGDDWYDSARKGALERTRPNSGGILLKPRY